MTQNMSRSEFATPPRSAGESGAQALVRELENQGVHTVFGYPGGAIMPVYDALVDARLKHILVRNEQGAALAACGYARVSGDVGVCLATSGPGATNLITGIADAYRDSVPMVAITGQVPTDLMGTDAFQEIDVFGMTLPIVKHSFLVEAAEEVRSTVRLAFEIASSGRPGPVLIDIPKDIATSTTTHSEQPPALTAAPSIDESLLRRASVILAHARRPVVYAGGGLRRESTTAAFRAFVDTLGAPVVTTLHGIGALPSDHPMLLGMLGMHGTRAANEAIQNADLLVCLGVSFDDRATGRLSTFAPRARVLHVDIDRAELGKLRQPHLAIHGDVGEFLHRVQAPACADPSWRRRCSERACGLQPPYDPPGDTVFAPAFLRELTQRDPTRWTITCDVGQHQMWVAQHARFAGPRQHISSGGLGTMGFGIPAAIGACIAEPNRDVLVVSGDGSLLMNVQELATIKRYDLPVKIVVFDNSSLGLVRQWQSLFFKQRYSEVDLSDNPDFVAVAESFGIPARRCARREDVTATIEALEATPGPLLVHVPIDARAQVWPLVPPNGSNDDMLEGPSCTTS